MNTALCNGASVERQFAIDAALKAARALLMKIDDITTDEFSRGGERREREALRAALAKLEA